MVTVITADVVGSRHARFNEIADNRQFAEYYLIGTLLSFMVALAAGLDVRAII